MVAAVQDGDPVVVGIDPGLTTGFAAWRPGGLPEIGGADFASGQVEGRFSFYDSFDMVAAWGRPLVVVMERFTITAATARKSPQLDPLYIIGAIERQAKKHGWPFVMQTPAKAKSFATDDKLKAVEWWNKGKEHANDAARHLLTYVVDTPAGKPLLDRIIDALGLRS